MAKMAVEAVDFNPDVCSQYMETFHEDLDQFFVIKGFLTKNTNDIMPRIHLTPCL